MKIRTINKTLCSVHHNFCESIEDPEVKKLVKDNTIITGGCITSMLLQEDVNDYDFYFRNRKTAEAVTKYYVEKFKELKIKNADETEKEKIKTTLKELYVDNLEENRIRIITRSSCVYSIIDTEKNYRYFETIPEEEEASIKYVESVFETLKIKGKHLPILITSNAITLSNKIQLVIRFFGEPEEIHKNYDFVHATNYWTSWDKKISTNTDALACILTKELKYVGSLYPLCSMIRTRKFIKRGWSIHAGQILKIAFQINELDLTDLNVLKEQLTGVDFAYFMEVIEILKNEAKNDSKKSIDAIYLAQIIDKVIG